MDCSSCILAIHARKCQIDSVPIVDRIKYPVRSTINRDFWDRYIGNSALRIPVNYQVVFVVGEPSDIDWQWRCHHIRVRNDHPLDIDCGSIEPLRWMGTNSENRPTIIPVVGRRCSTVFLEFERLRLRYRQLESDSRLQQPVPYERAQSPQCLR